VEIRKAMKQAAIAIAIVLCIGILHKLNVYTEQQDQQQAIKNVQENMFYGEVIALVYYSEGNGFLIKGEFTWDEEYAAGVNNHLWMDRAIILDCAYRVESAEQDPCAEQKIALINSDVKNRNMPHVSCGIFGYVPINKSTYTFVIVQSGQKIYFFEIITFEFLNDRYRFKKFPANHGRFNFVGLYEDQFDKGPYSNECSLFSSLTIGEEIRIPTQKPIGQYSRVFPTMIYTNQEIPLIETDS